MSYGRTVLNRLHPSQAGKRSTLTLESYLAYESTWSAKELFEPARLQRFSGSLESGGLKPRGHKLAYLAGDGQVLYPWSEIRQQAGKARLVCRHPVERMFGSRLKVLRKTSLSKVKAVINDLLCDSCSDESIYIQGRTCMPLPSLYSGEHLYAGRHY